MKFHKLLIKKGIMKKTIVMLFAVVLVSFGGTALAMDHKVNICHNGSTYNSTTMMEEDISFVISISGKGNAVQAHIDNHADCLSPFIDWGPGLECELESDGITVMCKEVTLCECLEI
jgi:hypothetical protein